MGKKGVTLSIIFVLLFLAGCGKKAEEQVQMEAGNHLTVYAVLDEAFYDTAIQKYQKDYPDIEIELISFDTKEDLANRYANDVGTGSSPDVLLLTDKTALDVGKAVRNGSFANLTPYFSSDDSYRSESYLDVAMEAGSFDGRQYIIPLRMNAYTYMASEDYYQDMDIAALGALNGAELSEMLMGELAKESGKIASVADPGGDIVRDILRASGLRLASLQSVPMNKEEVNTISEFTRFVVEQQENIAGQMSQISNQGDMLDMVGLCFMGNNPISDVKGYGDLHEFFFNKEIRVLPTPTIVGRDSHEGVVINYGVVDAKSSNIRGAYDFLRYMMDYTDINSAYKSLYVKVENNRSFLEYSASGTTMIMGTSSIPVPKMPNENKERLSHMLDHITQAYVPNSKVEEIYVNMMRPYFEGTADFDSCYNELQNRLNIYWNE